MLKIKQRGVILFVSFIALSAISCDGRGKDGRGKKKKVKHTIIKMINAIDTKKWDVARAQFSEDVFVDYSSLSGQAGSNMKANALVDGWEKLLAKVSTHHMLGNFDITINKNNKNEAESFSHVYASHQAEGVGYWDAYGRYHHKLKKTPDGWKIVFKKLIMHGQKGNENFLQDVSKE